MEIGLVHGRFQPFHNGHKYLVDKMLDECDIGVVLIGSSQKNDENNPYSLEERYSMIQSVYGKLDKLKIGANIDLKNPTDKNAQWGILFSSCVLSLTGFLPTKVYGAMDYNISWDDLIIKIIKYRRFQNISATQVRMLIKNNKYEEIKNIVPKEIYSYLIKNIYIKRT